MAHPRPRTQTGPQNGPKPTFVLSEPAATRDRAASRCIARTSVSRTLFHPPTPTFCGVRPSEWPQRTRTLASARLSLTRPVWPRHAVFAPSCPQMYGCIMDGGALVIQPKGEVNDPKQLADLVAAERVTDLSQTPSAFSILEPYLVPKPQRYALRTLTLAGEKVIMSRHRDFLNAFDNVHRRPRLINVYGPSECTIFCTGTEITPVHIAKEHQSNIGKSLHTIYILDNQLQRVPVGALGQVSAFTHLRVQGRMRGEGEPHECTRRPRTNTRMDRRDLWSVPRCLPCHPFSSASRSCGAGGGPHLYTEPSEAGGG